MPLPLLAVLAGAAFGARTKKQPQKQAVSRYTKKNGTKVKAYTRKTK